jgi:long-subunit fatty acid transport protein
MTFRSSPIPLALLGATLLGVPVRAQSPIGLLITNQSRTGFTVQGAGARAMGLGGAFIAVADDATAVSFNPAGLAQLMKPEFSFVGRDIQRQVSYQEYQTSSRGNHLAVTDSLIGSNHFDPLLLAATVPLRVGGRNLSLQLSAQRAFALDEGDSRQLTETPLNPAMPGGPTQVNQSIHQSGQIDIYSVAMAYECSQRILLGVAFNQWRGRWDLDSLSSQGVIGTESYLNFHQSNRLDGQNFNLGLLWRWPTWSLGLVHRTPFKAEYSYATSFESNLPLTNPSAYNMSDVGLHWPTSTGLGFAYRLPGQWLLAADLEHTAWANAKFMSDDKTLNGMNFFNLSRTNEVPDATSLRMGVEKIWATASGMVLPFRMGLSREPQPVIDSQTGQERIMYGVSIGSGIKQGRYTVDFAYRYGWAKRRASQFMDVDQLLAGTQTQSLGTERTVEQRADITFIMQFERQPLERLLRYLFVGD